jgi:hypothetical protein
MNDESLSFIAPNFENVPTKLQGISFEKVRLSPASDGERASSRSHQPAPS